MLDVSSLPSDLAEAVEELSKKISFDTTIEKGANGYVLVGHNSVLGRKVVVKFYYWGDGVHAEPRFLSDLASPHVLKVDDAATIKEGWAYFITPFCEQGDLDDLIAKRDIGVLRAVDYLLEMASGASYIHGKGFLHRDLKPSNVFCENNGTLVIGDFGSVVKRGASGYTNTISKHSLIYRTPEEVLYQRAYEQGDVYQLGIILYQMLGGYLPYNAHSWLSASELAHCSTLGSPDNQFYANDIIERKIASGRLLDFKSLPPWCPPQLIKTIRKCCHLDHASRFSNASALITHLANLRPLLPDWRLEPMPTLYRGRYRLRIVPAKDLFAIEKNVTGLWRKVNKVKPTSISLAVEAAEKL